MNNLTYLDYSLIKLEEKIAKINNNLDNPQLSIAKPQSIELELELAGLTSAQQKALSTGNPPKWNDDLGVCKIGGINMPPSYCGRKPEDIGKSKRPQEKIKEVLSEIPKLEGGDKQLLVESQKNINGFIQKISSEFQKGWKSLSKNYEKAKNSLKDYPPELWNSIVSATKAVYSNSVKTVMGVLTNSKIPFISQELKIAKEDVYKKAVETESEKNTEEIKEETEKEIDNISKEVQSSTPETSKETMGSLLGRLKDYATASPKNMLITAAVGVGAIALTAGVIGVGGSFIGATFLEGVEAFKAKGIARSLEKETILEERAAQEKGVIERGEKELKRVGKIHRKGIGYLDSLKDVEMKIKNNHTEIEYKKLKVKDIKKRKVINTKEERSEIKTLNSDIAKIQEDTRKTLERKERIETSFKKFKRDVHGSEETNNKYLENLFKNEEKRVKKEVGEALKDVKNANKIKLSFSRSAKELKDGLRIVSRNFNKGLRSLQDINTLRKNFVDGVTKHFSNFLKETGETFGFLNIGKGKREYKVYKNSLKNIEKDFETRAERLRDSKLVRTEKINKKYPKYSTEIEEIKENELFQKIESLEERIRNGGGIGRNFFQKIYDKAVNSVFLTPKNKRLMKELEKLEEEYDKHLKKLTPNKDRLKLTKKHEEAYRKAEETLMRKKEKAILETEEAYETGKLNAGKGIVSGIGKAYAGLFVEDRCLEVADSFFNQDDSLYKGNAFERYTNRLKDAIAGTTTLESLAGSLYLRGNMRGIKNLIGVAAQPIAVYKDKNRLVDISETLNTMTKEGIDSIYQDISDGKIKEEDFDNEMSGLLSKLRETSNIVLSGTSSVELNTNELIRRYYSDYALSKGVAPQSVSLDSLSKLIGNSSNYGEIIKAKNAVAVLGLYDLGEQIPWYKAPVLTKGIMDISKNIQKNTSNWQVAGREGADIVETKRVKVDENQKIMQIIRNGISAGLNLGVIVAKLTFLGISIDSSTLKELKNEFGYEGVELEAAAKTLANFDIF